MAMFTATRFPAPFRNFLSLLAIFLVAASSPCYAFMSIDVVTKERAKELGMQVRSHAAGPGAVRVELEFEIKGELKDFSRVDLEITEGGKLLSISSLLPEPSKPGRVLVGFAADRASLDKFTLRVVTGVPRNMAGYEIRLKEFVEVEKAQ
jgi:hypothetical protein